MSKLNNKIAVVTGGNSGIGLAAAKLFAAEGAKVIITGRRQRANDEAVAEIGLNASGIVCDAAKLEDTDRMIEQVQKEHGRIDVLHVNAGVVRFGSIAETDESKFDTQFDINVKGLFFTIQKALPLMKGGGSVILTSSVAHKGGYPGGVVYAATKAAVRSIGQSAAIDFAEQGIRVNTISPGPVETPIFCNAGMPENKMQQMAKQYAEKSPLRRFAQPDEIANVALFLASDDSSYVTGADFQADGGLSQRAI